MAMLSFKLNKLFIVLVPELVVDVDVVVTLNFPDEPDFVQNALSIMSNLVLRMILSLHANPNP
jgi:hypothetical protein